MVQEAHLFPHLLAMPPVRAPLTPAPPGARAGKPGTVPMRPAPEHATPAFADGATGGQQQESVYERAPDRLGPGSIPPPIVLYFHGRGQRPLTAERVAPAFMGARLIAPTGGVLLARGTTWFENQQIGVAEPQSLLADERRLLAWLSAYLGEAVRPWLCGFSNGGAFAAHLLLRHPHRFRGAAPAQCPIGCATAPSRGEGSRY